MQKSLIRYQGSKALMIQKYQIQEFIPKIDHDHPYCELFAGSAVMFFNLEYPFMHAFLNDLNQDLVNFWIQVRDHREAFEQRLNYVWCAHPRIDWKFDLTDNLDRAVQFYLQQTDTSNHISKPTFLEKNIQLWTERLNRARVKIDANPFEKEMDYLSKLYTLNDPERPCYAVFYEDPPYFGSDSVYKKYYKEQKFDLDPESFDHALLAQKNHELADKGHHIILSYNDCWEIRGLYADWYLESFEYSPNGRGAKRAKNRNELLLSNHPLKRQSHANLQITDFLNYNHRGIEYDHGTNM